MCESATSKLKSVRRNRSGTGVPQHLGLLQRGKVVAFSRVSGLGLGKLLDLQVVGHELLRQRICRARLDAQKYLGNPACLSTALAVWRDLILLSTTKCT